jgi:hypothetical protein
VVAGWRLQTEFSSGGGLLHHQTQTVRGSLLRGGGAGRRGRGGCVVGHCAVSARRGFVSGCRRTLSFVVKQADSLLPDIGGQFFRSRLGLPLANELVGIFGIDVSGVGWASIMQWRQIKLRLSSRKLLLAKKLQSRRKKLIMPVSICHRSY